MEERAETKTDRTRFNPGEKTRQKRRKEMKRSVASQTKKTGSGGKDITRAAEEGGFEQESPLSAADGPLRPCLSSQSHHLDLYLRHSTIKMSNRRQVYRL